MGDCPQPCRFRYRISSVESSSQSDCCFDAEEGENGVYLLNSKDLCTISILPAIIATGVNSLKIEGRNKSIHYVASVVKTYREALDECMKDPQKYVVHKRWIDELEKVEHRPYTTGFYGEDSVMQEVFSSKAASNSRVIGIVKGVLEGGIPVIDVKNSFAVSDVLEVLPVKRFSSPYTISFTHFTDLSGNPVQKIPSNRLYVVTELRYGFSR
jgi:putative protease